MPLPQLDEEQQKEFDTLVTGKVDEGLKSKLTELGYDEHAKKVIEKRGREAQDHRERADRFEKDLKELRDAESKRKADEETAKNEAARKQKEKDDAEKPLADRLATVESSFKDELAKRDKVAADERKALEKQLKARDEVLVRRSVVSALKEKGAIDADLISTALDLSVVTVEDGDINDEELTALIDAVVEERPHLFKKKEDEDETQTRDEQTGRFVRPKPASRKDSKDWSKASDAEFDAFESGLRSGRT